MRRDKEQGRLDFLKITLFSKTIPGVYRRVSRARSILLGFRETGDEVFRSIDSDLKEVDRDLLNAGDFDYDVLSSFRKAGLTEKELEIIHELELPSSVHVPLIRKFRAGRMIGLVEVLPWMVRVYEAELRIEGLFKTADDEYRFSNPGSREVLGAIIKVIIGGAQVGDDILRFSPISILLGLERIYTSIKQVWASLPGEHPLRVRQKKLEEFFGSG